MTYESLDFECPKCQENVIEEVESALRYSQICGFYDGWPEYDDSEVEGLETLRYQCWGCGMVLKEGYVLKGELQELIKEKGWYVGAAQTAEGDWEI